MGLKSHKQTGPIKIDIAGIFTMILGVVSLLLALTFGGKDYAWDSWQIIGLFALAVIGIVSFVIVETKAEEPILPMHFLKSHIYNTECDWILYEYWNVRRDYVRTILHARYCRSKCR